MAVGLKKRLKHQQHPRGTKEGQGDRISPIKVVCKVNCLPFLQLNYIQISCNIL